MKTVYNALDPLATVEKETVLIPYNLMDYVEQFGRSISYEKCQRLLDIHEELLAYLGNLYPLVINQTFSNADKILTALSKYTNETIIMNIIFNAGYPVNDDSYGHHSEYIDIQKTELSKRPIYLI